MITSFIAILFVISFSCGTEINGITDGENTARSTFCDPLAPYYAVTQVIRLLFLSLLTWISMATITQKVAVFAVLDTAKSKFLPFLNGCMLRFYLLTIYSAAVTQAFMIWTLLSFECEPMYDTVYLNDHQV